ncbi:uncharacterized protein Z518_00466 [Rhinocladiella mackenziei CBS 650.93]|uniref:BD-FAE-like domain-containing protein n=1 Tax=Rhinocladiella mackenziei CBS 650.93 TaxID=1442369 RepID=A0A0D2G408_9EURO|nr:uncharacterized protein Z518_00466 [Rhinocladiella mackenziei CBS 650.93]KIX09387.1 hypothetical protein Z518_00466 [Rhinocladiella mackenziei CBS 650.93]
MCILYPVFRRNQTAAFMAPSRIPQCAWVPSLLYNILTVERGATVISFAEKSPHAAPLPHQNTRLLNCPSAAIRPHASVRSPIGPRNVLIHLPPGPSIGVVAPSSIDRLSYLHTLLPPETSLVTINYRLGQNGESTDSSQDNSCFPVPIHDVSTAWSYLTSSTSPFNADQDGEPKICLLGSHIGGALATMLALTEPNRIHALAVVAPMVDWVGLDEVVEPPRATDTSHTPRQRQKHKIAARFGANNQSVIAAAEALIRLRAKLFSTPSSYFDPCASPLLFLRAPGRDTPFENTVGDQGVSVMGLDQVQGGDAECYSDGYWDQSASSASSPSSTTTTESSEQSLSSTPSAVSNSDSTVASDRLTPSSSREPRPPPRRRKVLCRWPSVGRPESVRLPYVKIFISGQREAGTVSEPPSVSDDAEAVDLIQGQAALMRAQGSELAELMRRACFFGREKGLAEERVHLSEQVSPGTNTDETISHTAVDQQTAQTMMQENATRWVGEIFARE